MFFTNVIFIQSIIFVIIIFVEINKGDEPVSQAAKLNLTRRILAGKESGETRPYMVYLRGASDSDITYNHWLCGGVIIHSQYILTSAACIEDAKNFYVISGTHRWIPYDDNENECLKNGALKAIWKCVPKSYVFDGEKFNNIKWMFNDIAVVKVEDNFNFERRVRGCDFIPKMIAFNNISKDLEKPGTPATIAGWGSLLTFSQLPHIVDRGRSEDKPVLSPQKSVNSPVLLEADTVVISRRKCKGRWPERYHYIIDASMICTKDNHARADCLDDLECKGNLGGDYYELDSEEEEEEPKKTTVPEFLRRRSNGNFSGLPEYINRRYLRKGLKAAPPKGRGMIEPNVRKMGGATVAGGFCENDHGGPLITGHGKTATVIGVISASLLTDDTMQCHGPYLYTSVWKHRAIIECVISRDRVVRHRRFGSKAKAGSGAAARRTEAVSETCKEMLRVSKIKLLASSMSWRTHPDGPARNELRAYDPLDAEPVGILNPDDGDEKTPNQEVLNPIKL